MRLGFDRLWLFLALALPALASLIAPLPAVDLAYQLRAGELILATGTIPSTDTFTFTAAGAPWVDQQWLAQILLALVHRAGGWELLAVLRATMVAAMFGFLAAAAVARGASARTAAMLAFFAFVVAATVLALRPQLLGMLAFAVLLWLVADRQRHPARSWLAPLVVVLWANVHGSVVLAPVLLGYAWLEDLTAGADHRHSLAVLVMGTLATLVNPFGPGVWAYAVGVGTNPEITGQVSEWQRTTPFTIPGLLFYVSAIAVAALVIVRRRLVTWPSLLWLAALFALGVWTVRGLAWWPMGAALVLAGLLPAAAGARRPRPNAVNVVLVGLVGLVLVAALPWWRPVDPLTGRVGLLTYAPSGLAAALRADASPGDRVFVPQSWGSWFEWAFPDALVFVDSRIELFPTEVWHDYDTLAGAGSGWEAVLDDRGVTHVVTAAGDPLSAAIASATGWCRSYADDDGAIYGRAALGTQPGSCP